MTEKYANVGGYVYCASNPIKYIDPTGMELWLPVVDDLANVTYVAEKGDNAKTFESQYGLSTTDATKILQKNNLPTDGDIKEGSTVSGESAKEVTGSDILKLDWKSSQATNQRKVDQLMFAIDYAQIKNISQTDGSDVNPTFDMSKFNTNMYDAWKGFRAYNVNVSIGNSRIPIKRVDASFSGQTKVTAYPAIKQVPETYDYTAQFYNGQNRTMLLLRFDIKYSDKFCGHYLNRK
jgi:hypothetical protein